MRSRSWVLCVAIAVSSLAPCFAHEDDSLSKDEATAAIESIANRVAALRKEFEESLSELETRYRTAPNDNLRQKIGGKIEDSRITIYEEALELIREQPDDPARLPAFVLAIELARNDDQRKEVMDLLKKHHVRSVGIGACARSFDGKEGEKFLRKVVDENPSRDDQAKALFKLATNAQKRAGGTFLNETQRQKAVALARQDYETLRDKFADANSPYGNTTYAQLAEVSLIRLENILIRSRNIERLVIGKEVPEIEGEDLDGVAFKLSDYRGKVTFLVYWAHWCDACVEKFPYYRSLAKRMSGRPFVLLGVNGDSDDDDLKAKNEEAEVTWRSFKNHAREDQPSISDDWNVRAWPTVLLIDADGIIRDRWIGTWSFFLGHVTIEGAMDAVIDDSIDKLVAETEAR